MANTFKNKVFGGGNVAANSDMSVYTCPASTTTVVIGLTVSNPVSYTHLTLPTKDSV